VGQVIVGALTAHHTPAVSCNSSSCFGLGLQTDQYFGYLWAGRDCWAAALNLNLNVMFCRHESIKRFMWFMLKSAIEVS